MTYFRIRRCLFMYTNIVIGDLLLAAKEVRKYIRAGVSDLCEKSGDALKRMGKWCELASRRLRELNY
ncbi:hypothetical protein A9K55_001729 [Cordyceps militaris]|uniref:Uncharacterized protein n=1 Tax=Cordyceps militaris TaxID=73501 RepID=A0A2H4SRS7_CORMI|nr:hypothetical protein A9K55_001729 [Cordyceps militaris]